MSKQNLLLACIGIFLLRVVLIVYCANTELIHNADAGDHLVYHLTAQQLVEGQIGWFTIGGEIGYRPPGYFAFLWLIYSLFNPAFLTGQLATAFLGTLNCVLLFFVTKKMSTDRIATFAFWMRGLLPCFIIADTFVLSEPLFAAFLLGILAIISLNLCKPTMAQAVLIGSLVAGCLLIREAALLYPVIFIGYLWLGTDKSLHHRLGVIACFCIAFVLVLSPWMYRNYRVWGSALPLSYTAGVNLHIGNNQNATGNYVLPPEGDMPTAVKWGTPQYEQWHRHMAMQYITENPSDFLLLGFKRIAWFLWPRFSREDLRVICQTSANSLLGLSAISGASSACLILLGLIGFIFAKRDWFWWISSALLLYSVTVTFIVVSNPRYRDIVDYLMIPYAAALLAQWRDVKVSVFQEGPYKSIKLSSVVILFILILGSWIWVGLHK